MCNVFNTSKQELKKQLGRNYWSIKEALKHLTHVTPTPQHKKYPQLSRDAFRRRHNEIAKLWEDTDHTQKPRNGKGDPKNPITQYSVQYFIKWALDRDVEIHWLNWAIEEKLLPIDIASSSQEETQSVQETSAPQKELHHKRERTYLLIIAALLHEQGIDWTTRNANREIRRLINSLEENAGKDAIGTVLKELASDELIEQVVIALRNRI